jgi:hypothetical protein
MHVAYGIQDTHAAFWVEILKKEVGLETFVQGNRIPYSGDY